MRQMKFSVKAIVTITTMLCTLHASLGLATDFPINFPTKPVRLEVGFAPTGGTDVMARLMANNLSEKWNQAVIVENRVGAEGTIASEFVSRAAPDGHTLLVVNASFAIPPPFKVNFDPVKNFELVALMATQPAVLVVSPTLKAQNLKDLIALAKARPGQLTYGSTGYRTEPALKMAQFLQRTGTRMLNVPYKGTAPIITAIMSGEVDMTFVPINTVIQLINSGQVRAIAVSTLTRSPILPSVETIEEAGDLKGFDAGTWYGVLAPKGIPKEIILKIHDDIESIVKSPNVAQTLKAQGFLPLPPQTPEGLEAQLSADVKRLTSIIDTLEHR
jgi:tripartite-type tricarboxylate transporter receptor subunit TctC